MARKSKPEMLVDLILSMGLDELNNLQTLISDLIDKASEEEKPKAAKKPKTTLKKVVAPRPEEEDEEGETRTPQKRPTRNGKTRARTEPVVLGKENRFIKMVGSDPEFNTDRLIDSRFDKLVATTPVPRGERSSPIVLTDCHICGREFKINESILRDMSGMVIRCSNCIGG